ncbi:TatD family hydrolase [Candidatus Woesearchaeota archaeon]|nr:TatD family hydrolase [Candidatus Woesearchaeota archaeon]
MQLVDVHCHLNHALYKDDLDAVIKRAKEAGVKVIVCSGVNPPGNRQVLELAQKYPEMVKACLGMYPIDALGLAPDETGLPRQTVPINLDEEFEFIKKNKDKILGIGEIGLDFHWDAEHHSQQEENFRKIIRFALELKKPIVIHSRKAEKECIDVLEQEIKNKEILVVMHCFSGNKKLIQRAAALGYYFSIPANIVKMQHFQMLAEMVDIQQLLTETDGPWLSPYANQKNESAFVIEAVKKIAEIKKLNVEEVAEQIWENYKRVFGR